MSCGSNEGRHCLGPRTKDAPIGQKRQDTGGRHRTDPDRVDVVQMRAAKLDPRRAVAERFVHDKVSDQRSDPRKRNVGVKRKRAFQRAKNPQFHKHHRDAHVEHQPNHPPRMRVR